MAFKLTMIRLIIIGGIALTAAISHANSIQNGSFEAPGFSPLDPFNSLPAGSTAIDGWVTIDNGADWHNEIQFSPAHDGNYVVDLSYNDLPGGISQSFATTIGQSYLLSFAMAGPNVAGFEDPRSLSVEVAGLSQTFTQDVSDPLNLVWGSKSLLFTANDTSTTLSFHGGTTGQYWGALIDSVSVVPTSVPEASSTIVLALIGVAALGVLGRRC